MARYSYPTPEFPQFASSSSSDGGQHRAQFNAVEYGRLSAMVALADGTLLCRQCRDKYVCYKTPCLPLIPPNTRTPYDEPVVKTHHRPKEGTKHRVACQVHYLSSNFPRVYVPLELLCQELSAASRLADHHSEFDVTLNSAVAFLPYQLPRCHGCVFFASGPNLEHFAVGLLLEGVASREATPPPSEEFQWFLRLQSPSLHVEVAETYQLPGRVRQVEALSTQGRGLLCVRSEYHVGFFEAPSTEDLLAVLKQYHKSLQQCAIISDPLLLCLGVYGTDVAISCVRLSPYIAGEAVLVMESGGVYLWNEEEGMATLQSPLTTPTSTDPAHFWQCCYGAHPRSLVLAEQWGISLGDFRTGHLTFTPFFTFPNEHLSPTTILTCLSPHPSHSHHLLVVTTETLLLLDSRQPHTPLLAAHHESNDPPRFLSTLQTTSRDTLVLLSTFHGHKNLVYAYSGGWREGETTVGPPYFSCVPHSVANYSEFDSHLEHGTSHTHYRLQQPLAGSCLAELPGDTYIALVLSTLGDLFFQCWNYQDTLPPSSSHSPPHQGYQLWVQEALEQEKQLLIYREQLGTENFEPVVAYLGETKRRRQLCPHCCHLANTCHSVELLDGAPSEVGMMKERARTEDDESTQTEGSGSKERCSFCGRKLEPYYHYRSCWLNKVVEGQCGMEALRTVCDIQPPATDLEERLWQGWEEGGGPSEVEGSSSQQSEALVSPTPTPVDEEVELKKPKLVLSKSKLRKMGF